MWTVKATEERKGAGKARSGPGAGSIARPAARNPYHEIAPAALSALKTVMGRYC
jgi:hypothetical protein